MNAITKILCYICIFLWIITSMLNNLWWTALSQVCILIVLTVGYGFGDDK